MRIRKTGILAAVLMSAAFMLTGCGGSGTDNAGTSQTEAPAATQAAATAAPEASETAKTAILTVSFGTSYNDSRDKTIGAIEKALETAYPDYDVRRAFTSQIIIDKLKERDNLEIDNVDEAIERLVNDGIKNVVVQPTHLMHGFEYDDLKAAVDKNKDKFDKIEMGAPLLSSDEDFSAVADAVKAATAEYDKEGTAIVFMGHGTEHESNAVYEKLQKVFDDKGYTNYFIGTVEATPSLDDMVAAVKEGGYTKVVLEPLMVVAGDHANNDMAGDEEDSWKSVFQSNGFEVECVLKGLGEFEDIQKLYVAHAGEAAAKLK